MNDEYERKFEARMRRHVRTKMVMDALFFSLYVAVGVFLIWRLSP